MKIAIPILLYALAGTLHAEQALIEKPAACDFDKHFAEASPLHAAAWKADAKALAAALQKSSDVNIKTGSLFCNGQGALMTPLHLAVQKGSVDCVKLLLEKNADVNAWDFLTRTPLHYACLLNAEVPAETRLALIKLLIEKNADVNFKDNDDRTPLDLLTGSEGNKALREYLASQNAVSGKK